MKNSTQHENIYIHKENTVSPVLMRGAKVTVRGLDEEGVSGNEDVRLEEVLVVRK